MAAAIPVVASDFPQVRAIVEDAGCGIVVDTTRPGAIAAAVNDLRGGPGRRSAEMGERGRLAIEDRYNWSTSAAELRALYDSVYAGVDGRSAPGSGVGSLAASRRTPWRHR